MIDKETISFPYYKNNQANLNKSPQSISSNGPAAWLFVPELPLDLSDPCPEDLCNKSTMCCWHSLEWGERNIWKAVHGKGGVTLLWLRGHLFTRIHSSLSPCPSTVSQLLAPSPLCTHFLPHTHTYWEQNAVMQWFFKWGPWTISVSITWEHVRDLEVQILRPHPRHSKLGTLSETEKSAAHQSLQVMLLLSPLRTTAMVSSTHTCSNHTSLQSSFRLSQLSLLPQDHHKSP